MISERWQVYAIVLLRRGMNDSCDCIVCMCVCACVCVCVRACVGACIVSVVFDHFQGQAITRDGQNNATVVLFLHLRLTVSVDCQLKSCLESHLIYCCTENEHAKSVCMCS